MRINSFIRHADSVKIANIAQIVNVIAPILTKGDEMVLQTIFYPIEMFTKRRTGKAMRIAVDGPDYVSKDFGRAKFLDASAILARRDEFTQELVDRYVKSHPPDSAGRVHVEMVRLEVEAEKLNDAVVA